MYLMILMALVLSYQASPPDYELLYFSAQPRCDSGSVELWRIQPALTNRIGKNDTTRITVSLVANCENNWYGAFEIDRDTLRLYFMRRGELPERKKLVIENGFKPWRARELSHSMCDCLYRINYTIRTTKKLPEALTINSMKVVPADKMITRTEPTFELHGGDTINFTDDMGHMQGKWIFYNVSGSVSIEEYYRNNIADSTIRYSYENGTLHSKVFSKKDHPGYSEVLFFPNGIVRANCVSTIRYVTPVRLPETAPEESRGVFVRTCWNYNSSGQLLGVESVVEE